MKIMTWAAAGILIVASAVAADDDRWTGAYIGGHLGGAHGLSDWLDTGAGDIGHHHSSGILGGFQGGYNYSVNNWVLGGQADVSFNSIDGRHPDAIFNFGPFPEFDNNDSNVLGTLMPRLGYSWGPAMVYGKVGAAWIRQRYFFSGFFEEGRTFAETTETHWGWTPGAGLEFGLGPRWSAFVEYNYLDFGTARTVVTCTTVPDCGPPGAGAITVDISENFNVVKAGVNFNLTAP